MTSNYSAEQAVTVKIPVVLTIKDAMQKIKQDCPDTAISEHFLRQLIRDGVKGRQQGAYQHGCAE